MVYLGPRNTIQPIISADMVGPRMGRKSEQFNSG